MSSLVLDAEALYADLLQGIRQQLAACSEAPRLVGVASGGAWLVQRLQKDLGLSDAIGILNQSLQLAVRLSQNSAPTLTDLKINQLPLFAIPQ